MVDGIRGLWNETIDDLSRGILLPPRLMTKVGLIAGAVFVAADLYGQGSLSVFGLVGISWLAPFVLIQVSHKNGVKAKEESYKALKRPLLQFLQISTICLTILAVWSIVPYSLGLRKGVSLGVLLGLKVGLDNLENVSDMDGLEGHKNWLSQIVSNNIVSARV